MSVLYFINIVILITKLNNMRLSKRKLSFNINYEHINENCHK